MESCGANQFQNTTGYCHRCSYSYGLSATEAECAKCDSSGTPRHMLDNGYCAPICRTNQFQDTSGYCYPCSDSYGREASADECAKCLNREMRNGFCIKKGYCPEGFLSSSGSCYPCSTSSGLLATAAECAKCDASSTPRVLLENGYCALESCGANQFQSTSGYCYSCSASGGYVATATECAKCDDSGTPRYMSGGYCTKCPTRLSSSRLNTQEKCESCHGTWDAGTQKCS